MQSIQLPEILDIPPKLLPIILDLDKYRYFLIEGGRGSGKSQTVGRFLLYLADQYHLRIFCGREIQNSIEESVYMLFVDLIKSSNMAFSVGATKIDHNSSGSSIRFKGFREQGAINIKGLEGIHILWIEEAQAITKNTLDIIIPTVRKNNSKVFFTMNRTLADDPVYVAMKDREDCLHIHIDYFENQHCPDALKHEAQQCKIKNLEDYKHIWLGEPLPQALNAAFRGVEACAVGELCEPAGGDEYVLGVDLARSVDYTVLSVLNKRTKNFDYVERLENENRTSWNYQVEKIKAVSKKYNNALTILDSTGVGDPIVENLQREGVNVYHHQKPESDDSTPGIKFSSVNKENLVEKLKVAIELKLITYPNIKFLVDELREFICETTSAGRHRYSAPQNKHDDAVISVALAVWGIRDEIYLREKETLMPSRSEKFWTRIKDDIKKNKKSFDLEDNEVMIKEDGFDVSENGG